MRANVLKMTDFRDGSERRYWCLHCKRDEHADCTGATLYHTKAGWPMTTDCDCPVCRQPKESHG